MPILYIFICSFGFWTLLCNLAVCLGLSLDELRFLSPFPLLAGITCALWINRRKPPAVSLPDPPPPSPGPCLLIPLAVTLLLAPRHYNPFWLAATLYLIFLLLKNRANPQPFSPSPIRRRDRSILALLAVASAAITYLAHRPAADDAYFVGVIVDAVAHPNLPLLHVDHLYGDHRFSLILPAYAVASFEPLSALFARLFGGDPLVWAYAVTPTAFALLIPYAWAAFLRHLTPRWLAATIVSFALLLLLGESVRSLGNFAFVRLCEGKSLLPTIIAPLLFAWTWDFQKSADFRDWLKLFLCAVAGVGTSSSGLFVVPLAIAIAAASAWRPSLTRRALAALLAAAYPITCALVVRHNMAPFVHILDVVHPSIADILLDDFGSHGQLLIFAALLATPLLAPGKNVARLIAAAALLIFLGPLNPILRPLFMRLTSGEVLWRTLWSFPFVGLAALALCESFRLASTRGKPWTLAAAALALLLAIALLPFNTLRPSNLAVTFSLWPLKVPPDAWALAQSAAARTPPGQSLLAPETITTWIPLLNPRPILVSVRDNYDVQMSIQMPPDEAADRRDLRELVSGTPFPSARAQSLIRSLPRYHVGLIILSPGADPTLLHSLSHAGFISSFSQDGFLFLKISQN